MVGVGVRTGSLALAMAQALTLALVLAIALALALTQVTRYCTPHRHASGGAEARLLLVLRRSLWRVLLLCEGWRRGSARATRPLGSCITRAAHWTNALTPATVRGAGSPLHQHDAALGEAAGRGRGAGQGGGAGGHWAVR